jgi:hypothetical protein
MEVNKEYILKKGVLNHAIQDLNQWISQSVAG